MDERGLKITHTTIIRWNFRYSDAIKNKVRLHLRKNLTFWRLDETYIKVKKIDLSI
ncbi:hypothetical protein HOG98_04155 [bacterium]|nr:hypothetical protein [bacterium]